MAETKNTPTDDEFGPDLAPLLPSWDFTKVNPFVGQILSSKIVPDVIGLTGEPREVPLFTIVNDDGERFVIWGSGMLSRILPEHVGHRVRIEDKGLKQQEDKTQLRVFDVRCRDCTQAGRV